VTANNTLTTRWRFAFDVVVTLVAMVVAVWLFNTGALRIGGASAATSSLPSAPFELGRAPSEGVDTAPVVIVEFSDFQCPYCSQFSSSILPTLRRDYLAKGTAQLYFRHLPLTALHPHARGAAISADCAHQQGRFWPAHDLIFSDPAMLASASQAALATGAGLEPHAFQECLGRSTHEQIDQDAALADRLKVTGTPTFMIGWRVPNNSVKVVEVLRGAQPLSKFEAAITHAMSTR